MSDVISLKKNKFKYVVIVSFIFQLLNIFLICGIFIKANPTDFYINQTIYMHTNFYCIVLSIILLFGFLRQDVYNKGKINFILLGISLTTALIVDTYVWFFEGKPQYKFLIIFCFTIYFIMNTVIDYFFWHFIKNTYDEEEKKYKKIEKKIVLFVLIIGILLPILNAFFGFASYIDENAIIHEIMPNIFIIYMPTLILTVMLFYSIMRAKIVFYERIILLSYIFVPVVLFVLSIIYYSDANLYYPLLFAVYVFMFCNLVVLREKENLQNEIVLAEKNRELNIASKIQESMLPNNFNEYEKYGVDIFAYMDPAKEVGGDFYDFFMVDEDRLAIVIADVSEKGVPASLFMSIGKVLLEKAITEEETLSKALNSVHKTIIKNNERGTFITLFVAILDLKNNTMTYVNAGHCLPLIKESGDKFKYLEDIHGTFIGCKLFKEMNYGESVIDFKKGDILCLYTDGVSEAQNNREELFGTERLLKCVNNIDVNANSKDTIEHIINDVKIFEEQHQQADDITILCIKCIK